MNRLLRVIVALVAIFVFVEVLAYISWQSHIHRARSFQAQSMLPYVTQFEQKLSSFRNYKIFRSSAGIRNAGEFLNDRIGWNVSGSQPTLSDVRREFFYLQPYTRELIEHRKEHWPLALGPSHFAFYNLGWMKDLHQYDYWDVDNNSLRSRHFYMNRGSMLSLPEPRLSDFEHIAKVRLSQSRNAEEVKEAIHDLRHFARLLITTELPDGAMAAARILRDEAQFIEAYTVRNISMVPDDYTAIPVEVIDAYENAVRLNLSAFHLVTPAETFLAAYGVPGSNREFSLAVRTARQGISICPAINHNLKSAKYVKPLLGSSREGRYNHMKAVLDATRNSCRVKLARAYWGRETDDIYRDKPYLYALPFGQWAVGSYLVSLSWPIFTPQGMKKPVVIDAAEARED